MHYAATEMKQEKGHPKLIYSSGCFGFQFQFDYSLSVNLSQLYEHGHTLDLNPEREYVVVLTDPKLQIYTYASDIFSRTFFKLKPKGGIKMQYLKVCIIDTTQLHFLSARVLLRF